MFLFGWKLRRVVLVCVSLHANELLCPAPFPEEGYAFTARASDTTAITNQENYTDSKRFRVKNLN